MVPCRFRTRCSLRGDTWAWKASRDQFCRALGCSFFSVFFFFFKKKKRPSWKDTGWKNDTVKVDCMERLPMKQAQDAERMEYRRGYPWCWSSDSE